MTSLRSYLTQPMLTNFVLKVEVYIITSVNSIGEQGSMIEPEVKNDSPLTNEDFHKEGNPRLSLLWRIAIVLLVVSGVSLLIGSLADSFLGSDYSRSGHVFRAMLTSLIVIPFIFGVRYFLDQRSWDGLGLSRLTSAWYPLLIGMICWIVPATVGIITCVVLGWTQITLQEPIGNILLAGVVLFFLVFIYEALPEELIFRGYFYRNLADEMPRWLAVLGQAILFVLWGLANGGTNSIDRSLLFFVAAIILGILRVVTGSLWASIGFHLAFQTMAQLFGTVGNQFAISDPQILTLFAFGILPFATAIPLLNMFYKNRPN